MSNVLFSS